MIRATATLDLRQMVKRIEVPIFVLQGALDVMAPAHLVEDWLAALDAPAGKQLFRFDGVGHNPVAEEPDRAFAILRDIAEGST